MYRNCGKCDWRALGLTAVCVLLFGCTDDPSDTDADIVDDLVDASDELEPELDIPSDPPVGSDVAVDPELREDIEDIAQLEDLFDAVDLEILDSAPDAPADSAPDVDEPAVETACDDGDDNDGDGREDCLDVDCDGVGICEFGLELSCGDGEDNDGDSGTDCDDPECATCDGLCCGQGWVCEDDQCKIVCTVGERCGTTSNICCEINEICFLGGCALPGDACTVDEDCGEDEYCELSLGTCLPLTALPSCEYHPTSDFEPVVEWAWDGSTEYPDYNMVVSAPIVINMTDDNADGAIDAKDTPDILFSTCANGAYSSGGYIRVVSGDTGAELMTFDTSVMGSATLAAGDSDPLPPGNCISVSTTWNIPVELQGAASYDLEAVADDLGDGTSTHNECDETNNAIELTVSCVD